MTNPSDPQANVRRSRGFALVWLVPIGALAIVLWLGGRELLGRGPLVTITFETADGLAAGRTPVRHKEVNIGTVESVKLSKDLSKVIVTARLNNDLSEHVTVNSSFWVVRPRLSAAGITGLNTIVSGAYIEMEPGTSGEDKDNFVGLEEPPLLGADQAGRGFILQADRLGSLVQGSPLYHRGILVGQVLGTMLNKLDDGVTIYVFVRAPYDALVHPQTLFWNASGFSLSAGSDGVKANIESLQALLAGGVAFDTGPEGDRSTEAAVNSSFILFGDEATARNQIPGPRIRYEAVFNGTVRGLHAGTPVQLDGVDVGQVVDAHLDYDPTSGRLSQPATLELEPRHNITIGGVSNNPTDVSEQTIRDGVARLVTLGLRAKLVSGNLLTGQMIVSLEMTSGLPTASLGQGRHFPEIPTTSGGDLGALTASASAVMDKVAAMPLPEIGQSLRKVLDNLDKATASPEMKKTLGALSADLADLDRLMNSPNAELPALIRSLQATSDAAAKTLDTANRQLGGAGQRGGDLQAMLRELTETARSVRGLTDFLTQHPEALLRGRAGDQP